MKFKLTTSPKFLYDQEEAEKLKKLGFEFKSHNDGDITRTDDDTTIKINSLKQLIDFIREYGQIVLTEDTIEIYNYYREEVF